MLLSVNLATGTTLKRLGYTAASSRACTVARAVAAAAAAVRNGHVRREWSRPQGSARHPNKSVLCYLCRQVDLGISVVTVCLARAPRVQEQVGYHHRCKHDSVAQLDRF